MLHDSCLDEIAAVIVAGTTGLIGRETSGFMSQPCSVEVNLWLIVVGSVINFRSRALWGMTSPGDYGFGSEGIQPPEALRTRPGGVALACGLTFGQAIRLDPGAIAGQPVAGHLGEHPIRRHDGEAVQGSRQGLPHKPRQSRLCWLTQKRVEKRADTQRSKAKGIHAMALVARTPMVLETDQRDLPNRVRALFTSAGNEADRVGPM